MSDARLPTGWEGTWDGAHLTEDTAHAWLDDALTEESARRATAHVPDCLDCAALVAEARGLAAAASRVLRALDEVPGAVIPTHVPTAPALSAPARGAGRRAVWWTGGPARAAAAVLVLAVGSTVVLRSRGEDAERVTVADSAAAGSAPAGSAPTDSAPVALTPASPPAAAPSALRALDAARPPTPAAPPVLAQRRRLADRAPAPGTDVPGPAVAKAMGDAAAPRLAPFAGAAPAPPAAPPAASVAAAESRADARAEASEVVAMRREASGLNAARARASDAPAGTIRGSVSAPDGRPVVAAQVQVVGSTLGAVTDDSGRFVVRAVPAGRVALRVRGIGYEQQQATVAVRDADTTAARIVARPVATALSQVLVTGAASDRAAALGTSTAGGGAAATAPGCWALRSLPGWTDTGAPPLPDRLRLEPSAPGATGGEALLGTAGATGWGAGSWGVRDADRIAVVLPALAGGEASLALRRDGRAWRGPATWTAPDAPTARRGGEVRLVADRCPARPGAP